MNIVPLKIPGSYEISLAPRQDERGFFMRAYDQKIFQEHGLNFTWVQENHSRSEQKGTFRGLHFQFGKDAETKMVRCLRGEILDVFVDLRKNSATFGQWDSIQLTESNKKMVIIPRGCAHGFLSMVDGCEVLYKVDNFYSPHNESNLLFSDPAIGIALPIPVEIVSERDKNAPTLEEFKTRHGYIDLD